MLLYLSQGEEAMATFGMAHVPASNFSFPLKEMHCRRYSLPNKLKLNLRMPRYVEFPRIQ